MQNAGNPIEIMKKWWKNTIVRASFLTSVNKSYYEPGGTMIVTHTRSTAHTFSAQYDRFNLGRWNSITLQGKNGRHTTIISIYRPSKYQETYLRQTAYTSKRRKVTPSISPEDMWYIDLRDVIQEKISLGHGVIVAGDFNDDLNDDNGRTIKFMAKLGLRELLIEKYGKGPATHIRGTKTIDGVFATANIQMETGYYMTFDRSPSDHRWIVIDIHEKVLLGTARDDLCPAILRKATSKIPSVKTAFQTLLDNQITLHRLHVRISNLYNSIVEGQQFSSMHANEYEAIEERMQRAVKYADSHCKKVRRGKVPFSPTQKKLMGEIIILQQIKLRFLLKGSPNRPKSRRIDRLVKKYKYQGEKKFTDVKAIDKAIQTATQNYNLFKGKAQATRWLYLEQIAKEMDEQDGKGRQHHYKILHHREVTKQFFKQIRFCEGKSRKGGVDRIQIGDGEDLVISYDKETIENEIMRANKQKLLQASDTPLRQYPISALLGEQGNFETWEKILAGSISLPDDVDEGLHLWYTYLINIQDHTPLDFTWTTEEYIQSWKKMNEEKMTLPGIQVAHIKCLDADSLAADVMSKLAMIPLMVGYAPTSWQNGIDSMIPKKVADLRPEKLRLILLMDARFNHNNKLIGKKMMAYGEKYGMLAPEQFGSRQHKSAIEHATNKRLVMDINRQSGTNSVYVANDAKACYDRILLMVAYLTMRKFGVPAVVAKSTIATILMMKHRVRTKYGDSKSYYGGDKWDTLPHGCGQGNGYGPALWACISSPLLHLMREYGHGTKIICPMSKNTIHIAAFAFADDVDLIQTHNIHEGSDSLTDTSIEQLMTATQCALDQWASTLRATGGALEPSKTFYVPIVNDWKGSTKRVLSPNTTCDLYINNSDGSKTTLKKFPPSDSFFTLGIWQSPSGSEEQQQEYLLQKIRTWDIETTTQKISWTLAKVAIRSTIGKTLTYPLTATTFTIEQCQRLQRELLTATLGKMGIVRTAPALIATAPSYFGGLGILSFEITQLLHHINLILQHGPGGQSMTNLLLHATMEHYALETGLPGDPLRLPYVDYVTPNSWISQTIYSIRKYNIDIQSTFQGLESWCDNDIFVMDKMRYFFSSDTLRVVNKVRMYLQVNTISDLVSADGNTYCIALLQGSRCNDNPSPSQLRYRWPFVPKPTSREKSIWFHSILTIFNISLAIDQTRPQVSIYWQHGSLQFSRWLYSAVQNIIYERTGDNNWQTWILASIRSHRYSTRSTSSKYILGEEVYELPYDCIPATVNKSVSYIFMVGHGGQLTSRQNTVPVDTARIEWVPSTKHLHLYLYNIRLNNGIIVSDGSHVGETATYAFLAQPPQYTCNLKDVNFDELVWRSGTIGGSSKDINSYRAELAGILSAITFTNNQCQHYKITTGSCTLYCDSKGALLASFGFKRPTPRWASYDLIWRIRQAISTAPITWNYKHVLGHQDKNIPFDKLDPIAQGNVIVDHLANQQVQESHTQLINLQEWSITVNGQMIGGNIETQLTSAIFRPLMKERWTSLFAVPLAVQNILAWDLFFKSIATQSIRYKPFLTKYNARLLPIGINLKRRRHSDSDVCPCCGAIEDHSHIIQCTHSRMTVTFEECMDKVKSIMQDNMSKSVSQGILWLLHSFGNPTSSEPCTDNWVHEQFLLGPRAFFAGLWLQVWVTQQAQYYSLIKSPRSAETWIIKVIHLIQLIPYHMWQTRNQVLHKTQDNYTRMAQHEVLNNEIDIIFTKKPHSRLMAHCDNLYFTKHGKETIKTMKLHRKQTWVAGAQLILTKYERTTTMQSQQFTSFFQWDRG